MEKKEYTFDRILAEVEQPLIASAKIWGAVGGEVMKGVSKPVMTYLESKNRRNIGFRMLRMAGRSFADGFYDRDTVLKAA